MHARITPGRLSLCLSVALLNPGVLFAVVHFFRQFIRGVQFASVHVFQQLIRVQLLNLGVQFTAVQLGTWVVSVTTSERGGFLSVNFGLLLMFVDLNLFSVTFEMTDFNVR